VFGYLACDHLVVWGLYSHACLLLHLDSCVLTLALLVCAIVHHWLLAHGLPIVDCLVGWLVVLSASMQLFVTSCLHPCVCMCHHCHLASLYFMHAVYEGHACLLTTCISVLCNNLSSRMFVCVCCNAIDCSCRLILIGLRASCYVGLVTCLTWLILLSAGYSLCRPCLTRSNMLAEEILKEVLPAWRPPQPDGEEAWFIWAGCWFCSCPWCV
jgi:hypothetical protein